MSKYTVICDYQALWAEGMGAWGNDLARSRSGMNSMPLSYVFTMVICMLCEFHPIKKKKLTRDTKAETYEWAGHEFLTCNLRPPESRTQL